MRCPFCPEEHAPDTKVCPTSRQRLEGLPREGEIVDGKYKILGVLGAGGMAAVYRAEHTKIGRIVALKVLLPEFRASPELVERVQREARAAGSIGHPNVVEIVDLGETAELGPYIAMEFLRGVDLATYAERNGRRLAPREAVEIVRQILAALAVAHGKGVIHRDLKPENVFLVENEEKRLRVRVLDFGISKLGEQHGVGKLTRVGTVIGTPEFMPPEQAIGAAAQDHRIDLYACGVVLYALLSGRLPYEAENVHVLVSDLINKPPAPLASRVRGLDPALDAIVVKAMARNPSSRYADARAMQSALAEWADSLPAGDGETPLEPADSLPRAKAPSDREPAPTMSGSDLETAPTEHAVVKRVERTPTLPLDEPDAQPAAPARRRGWLALVVVVACAGGALAAVRQFAPDVWNDLAAQAGLGTAARTGDPVSSDGGVTDASAGPAGDAERRAPRRGRHPR